MAEAEGFSTTAEERGWTWFCVTCGIERPPNPGIACPRPGCGTRAYGSRPPPEVILPPPGADDVRPAVKPEW